jgi:hypothetical protein
MFSGWIYDHLKLHGAALKAPAYCRTELAFVQAVELML